MSLRAPRIYQLTAAQEAASCQMPGRDEGFATADKPGSGESKSGPRVDWIQVLTLPPGP